MAFNPACSWQSSHTKCPVSQAAFAVFSAPQSAQRAGRDRFSYKSGLPQSKQEELFGGNTPEEAAVIFDSVLNNTALPAQINTVIANAAIAIQTINPLLSIEEAVDQARVSIESGAAQKAFKKFVAINS